MTSKPAEPVRLRFADRELDARRGRVTLRWVLTSADDVLSFEEIFDFGPPESASRLEDAAFHQALSAALDLLHWIAGISYWKLACRGEVEFPGSSPDADQIGFLRVLYRDGLAELAWRNSLDAPWWPEFPAAANEPRAAAPGLGLARQVLVPMGGGKDSLVVLDRVQRAGFSPITVQVGQAPLIAEVAEAAGVAHRRIGRSLDPKLRELNAAGALNGHVPITAIHAAALVFAALWWDCDTVAFANERSASRPTSRTVHGVPVNHQYAKSWDFEFRLSERIQRNVAADLQVFSLLRRDSELAACRYFAGLCRYHDVFSSCNRNFHLDGPRTHRWCLACPKCRFVYLGLAPFLEPEAMRAIFGADLLAEPGQEPGFAELLALDGPRPFECVGEAAESRSALAALAAQPAWNDHAVVRALSARLQGIEVDPLDDWLTPQGPHGIPEDLACA